MEAAIHWRREQPRERFDALHEPPHDDAAGCARAAAQPPSERLTLCRRRGPHDGVVGVLDARRSPRETVVAGDASELRQREARRVDIVEKHEDPLKAAELDHRRRHALDVLHVAAAWTVGCADDVALRRQRRGSNVEHFVQGGVLGGPPMREEQARSRLQRTDVVKRQPCPGGVSDTGHNEQHASCRRTGCKPR